MYVISVAGDECLKMVLSSLRGIIIRQVWCIVNNLCRIASDSSVSAQQCRLPFSNLEHYIVYAFLLYGHNKFWCGSPNSMQAGDGKHLYYYKSLPYCDSYFVIIVLSQRLWFCVRHWQACILLHNVAQEYTNVIWCEKIDHFAIFSSMLSFCYNNITQLDPSVLSKLDKVLWKDLDHK